MTMTISASIIQCVISGALFALSGFLLTAGLTPPRDERLLGIAAALFGAALVVGLRT